MKLNSSRTLRKSGTRGAAPQLQQDNEPKPFMSRQKPTHRGIMTNKKLCGEGNISRVGIMNGNDSEWLNSV